MEARPGNVQHGIIAVLDALGAADFSDEEIKRFMKSREIVLGLLNEKAMTLSERLSVERMTTFTFNDTVLIVLKADKSHLRPKEVLAFFSVLRKFIVDSLANRILFRGSIAIGRFWADEATNTIMGQAVSDATSWYNKTDWIGAVATPRTTIQIQRYQERDGRNWRNLMVDYDVPLKDSKTVRLKAVNWPKVFFLKNISPCEEGEKPREKLLEFLGAHAVPIGTEGKFFNTLTFFDKVRKQIQAENKRKKK